MAQFMAKKKAAKAVVAAAAATAAAAAKREGKAGDESNSKRRRTGNADDQQVHDQEHVDSAPPPLPPPPQPAAGTEQYGPPPTGRPPPGMRPPAGPPPPSSGGGGNKSIMMDALRRIKERKLAVTAGGGGGGSGAHIPPHAAGYNNFSTEGGLNNQRGVGFDNQRGSYRGGGSRRHAHDGGGSGRSDNSNEITAEEIEERLKYSTGDDDDEGMTLDQLKRKAEMARTAERARQLTAMSKRKHHIGDYIPEDDLERFLEKADAITSGREADLSDYKNYTIMEDNIGHKMLQKAGWKQGTGLGADEQGRLKPVDRDATAQNDTLGIGITNPAEVKVGDDALAQYRKRMSLGYKNRPNPLNNPRRSYGGYTATGMN